MISLGIDLGGTSAKLGVVEDGVILASATVATRADSDYEGIVHDLTEAAKGLLAGYRVRKAGIGSPGLIDSVTGKVCYSNNIKWSDAPLRDDIGRELGLPALIANDAKCAALGEVCDGRPESGSPYADAAGIFGHMTLYPGGRVCNCGRKGCLESYCSATAIAARARYLTGKKMTAKDVFDAARAGDAKAQTVIDEFSRDLGTALVSLANILRPECFVIGGGVSASADLFLPAVNETLRREVYGSSHAPVKAYAAKLGNAAGVIGAASLR